MKRVSFEVAKALKEAGYDEVCQYGYCVVDGIPTLVKTEEEWERHPINNSDMYDFLVCTCQEIEGKEDCTAPTYLEVWLWLWREKKYPINVDCHIGGNGKWSTDMSIEDYTDPEEAIIAAIESLVDDCMQVKKLIQQCNIIVKIL